MCCLQMILPSYATENVVEFRTRPFQRGDSNSSHDPRYLQAYVRLDCVFIRLFARLTCPTMGGFANRSASWRGKSPRRQRIGVGFARFPIDADERIYPSS